MKTDLPSATVHSHVRSTSRSVPRRRRDRAGRRDEPTPAEFAELFGLAYRAARKITHDHGNAEDVAQEALLKAMSRWSEIEAHARPWITRVATNLAIDDYRRRRPAISDTIELPAADDPAAAVAERDELAVALAQLTDRRREAIVMRLVLDKSPAETATHMGISEHGVLKHSARGIRELRQLMNDPATNQVAATRSTTVTSSDVPA